MYKMYNRSSKEGEMIQLKMSHMNRPFVLDKELISQSLLQKKNRKGYDITNADTTLYFKILLKSVINLFKSLMVF